MKTRTHFTFRVDTWTPDGEIIVEHVAGVESGPTRRISRFGDEMTRMMLYEPAQSMLAHSAKWSWLKAWAMKIARHRGMKKAIVALARRLAVIMHRIWVDGTEFRWTQEVAAA
jgi:transposase